MNSKTVWWIFIIIWCGMIFYQSSRPAPLSDGQSIYIVKVINQWASVIFGKEVTIVTNHMVRKAAHFTEYFILGLLLFNGFRPQPTLARAFLFAIIAGFCYSVSDELHQIFIPGRTAKITDVMIDTSGIVAGAGLVYLAVRNRIPGAPRPFTAREAA